MTLEECYTSLEGDYKSVVTRLTSERLVQKFVFKFLDDPSHDNLHKSIESGNYDEAFRAAHTIKGVCQNLSFDKLYKSSNSLAEVLRSGVWNDEYNDIVEQLDKDYEQTVAAIRAFKAEN